MDSLNSRPRASLKREERDHRWGVRYDLICRSFCKKPSGICAPGSFRCWWGANGQVDLSYGSKASTATFQSSVRCVKGALIPTLSTRESSFSGNVLPVKRLTEKAPYTILEAAGRTASNWPWSTSARNVFARICQGRGFMPCLPRTP